MNAVTSRAVGPCEPASTCCTPSFREPIPYLMCQHYKHIWVSAVIYSVCGLAASSDMMLLGSGLSRRCGLSGLCQVPCRSFVRSCPRSCPVPIV